MWIYSDIQKLEKKGKLNLQMTFTHSKGGGTWRILYRLRKQKGKLSNLFNIYAPDRTALRNHHKLDKVLITIKNCAFHDRHNTTGNVNFSTFKRRLAEVIGVEETNKVAALFVDRIKEEISVKA